MKDEQHRPQQPNDDLDAELDALLRDAARTYNRAPTAGGGPPDAEALWAAIDRALPPAIVDPAAPDATDATPIGVERPALTVVRGAAPRRARFWASPWLRTAAVLLLGVAIGRATVRRDAAPGRAGTALAPGAAAGTTPDADAGPPSPSDEVTNEYLGRAEALLAALPDELHARRADPAYLSQADALLLQTRLLLDSPAATDPTLRSLFDDLEIVFAQVVRLRAGVSGGRDATRIDFLTQALEERDVLPRLRAAVADNAVADNAAN